MRPIMFNTHLSKAMPVPMFTCVAQFNSMQADKWRNGGGANWEEREL